MSEEKKVTCLITAVPIEGESIEIEFNADSTDHLPDNIAYALGQVNNRLREINLTLIEDMNAKQNLTFSQYNDLRHIIDTQFPYTASLSEIYSSDSTRILVRKMTNQKEQIALRIAGSLSGEELEHYLIKFLDVTTERMIQTNINDEDAHKYLKALATEDQLAVQLVLDVLYNRISAEAAANRLAGYAEQRIEAEGQYL